MLKGEKKDPKKTGTRVVAAWPGRHSVGFDYP